MKRFRFRLDGLLRLRRVEEERCLGRLRERQAAVVDVMERRRELGRERTRTVASLRRHEQGVLSMEDVLRHRRYLVALENRTRELDAEVVRRRTELQEAQRAAERAIRERQLVERLRDRRREEHDSLARREELRELDEIGRGAVARREAIR